MPKVAQLTTVDAAANSAPAGPARAPRASTRYFAFLSYSHRDDEFVDWLHKELEQFRVPTSLVGRLTPNGPIPRRLTPIFRDEQDLSAARELGEEIEAALRASQYLIVICSPQAAQSHWTNTEIDLFKRTRPEGCVLAAVVSGEPFASDIPGRETEECFPPALRQRYDRRGRPSGRRAEPLAADFRSAGDGRRTAFLKLVAGILGIGLDELVQRETTRRQKRLAIITAASIAGMAVTSGLAVTAIQARDAARDQRREAEGLVAFMLGDLKDKLEPIGRLDALDGVGSRVLAYYSQQDAAELSDSGLLQRSRALSLTAEVAFLRGDVDTAERLYREAADGTAEAIRRSDRDPEMIFDHAQNVFWIGEISHKSGRIRQAEASFREYKRLADRMVELEPNNLRWRMEGLYADENIGIVLYSQRRYDEAARQFAGALRPMQNLASLEPGRLEYQSELSNLLAWLADAERARGRLDAAVAMRRRQLTVLTGLLESGSRHVEIRQQLIPAHQALGIILASQGKLDLAAAQLRLAAAEADRLIAVEPDNALWKGLAAGTQLELANVLLALNDPGAASKVEAGCAVTSRLQSRGADLARSRTVQTQCITSRARLAINAGNYRLALHLAERAVTSARAERSGDTISDRFSVAASYRLLGDVRQLMGESNAAKAAWAEGLSQLPRNVSERPPEIHVRAELLKRLDRRDEAEPLVARLGAIGYRNER